MCWHACVHRYLCCALWLCVHAAADALTVILTDTRLKLVFGYVSIFLSKNLNNYYDISDFTKFFPASQFSKMRTPPRTIVFWSVELTVDWLLCRDNALCVIGMNQDAMKTIAIVILSGNPRGNSPGSSLTDYWPSQTSYNTTHVSRSLRC